MEKHSKFWVASNLSEENATVQEFAQPEAYYTRENYITIMPARSRGLAEVLQHGETLNDTWVVIADKRIFRDKFKIGDRFYVDGEAPKENLEQNENYGYGSTANAEIADIANGDLAIVITLRRNQKQIKK